MYIKIENSKEIFTENTKLNEVLAMRCIYILINEMKILAKLCEFESSNEALRF